MDQSQTLHDILSEILGSSNVYFQPPEGYNLVYPCVIYELARIEKENANNHLYRKNIKYTVTVIDRDPDSLIPHRVMELPLCSHDRHFVNDNLHHDVFTLYFNGDRYRISEN